MARKLKMTASVASLGIDCITRGHSETFQFRGKQWTLNELRAICPPVYPLPQELEKRKEANRLREQQERDGFMKAVIFEY